MALFDAPNIQEIGFVISNISLLTFVQQLYNESWHDLDDIDWNNLGFDYYYHQLLEDESYWNMDFNWKQNDTVTYSLASSVICAQYDVFARYFPSKLKQFLEETGACTAPCGSDGWQAYTCSPFYWQNGVCDDFCNSQECGWDGNDCIQLSHYVIVIC